MSLKGTTVPGARNFALRIQRKAEKEKRGGTPRLCRKKKGRVPDTGTQDLGTDEREQRVYQQGEELKHNT